MLKIRLKRIGRKNLPVYKIVVMENLSKRDGKFIDLIGHYNPIKKQSSINLYKLNKYLIFGARPTDTVRHLINKTIEKNKN